MSLFEEHENNRFEINFLRKKNGLFVGANAIAMFQSPNKECKQNNREVCRHDTKRLLLRYRFSLLLNEKLIEWEKFRIRLIASVLILSD